MKIIFATTNNGKLKEVKSILGKYNIDVFSLKDIGLDIDIEENGKTFEENAIIKAKAVMEITNEIVMADDSGLEVDFINKEPGIYSARYLGSQANQQEKNKSIIDRLAKAKDNDRKARFVCSIACVFPDGKTITTHGVVEGLISYKEKGTNGFGYDPILYVPEYGMTMAELPPEIKNKISHRYKALQLMGDKINENTNCQ